MEKKVSLTDSFPKEQTQWKFQLTVRSHQEQTEWTPKNIQLVLPGSFPKERTEWTTLINFKLSQGQKAKSCN